MARKASNVARHVLITSVMMAAITAVGSTPFVQGDDGTYVGNVDDLITNTEEIVALKQIEAFTQIALTTGEIPVSDMLDRVGDRWISEYDSAEEFEFINTGTRSFINFTLTDDDAWNKENGQHYLKIYNFDTIISSVGEGHEITLLVSKLQKIQDRYDASEPVEKFHNWLATKYTTPESEQEIVDRLVEILGDEGFLKLAEKTAKSFNVLADNGRVPNELFDSHVKYWMLTTQSHICEFVSECDSALFLKYRSNVSAVYVQPKNEKLEDNVPTSGVWNYFIPYAHATSVTPISYVLSITVDATRCDYEHCSASKFAYKRPGRAGSVIIDSVMNDGRLVHADSTSRPLSYVTAKGMICANDDRYSRVYGGISTTAYKAGKLQPDLMQHKEHFSSDCIISTIGYDLRRSGYQSYGGKAETFAGLFFIDRRN